MTIEEAIDYVDDINRTVGFTKEQAIDEDFFESVAEWLEELNILRLQNHLGREEAFAEGKKEGYIKAIDDMSKLGADKAIVRQLSLQFMEGVISGNNEGSAV